MRLTQQIIQENRQTDEQNKILHFAQLIAFNYLFKVNFAEFPNADDAAVHGAVVVVVLTTAQYVYTPSFSGDFSVFNVVPWLLLLLLHLFVAFD